MGRHHYRIFSEGQIGPLTLSNRLVRSATWDPSILAERRMTEAVLDLYRDLALGGVGMIVTGDFSVVPEGMFSSDGSSERTFAYDDVKIEGFDRLVDVVRAAAPRCKIVVQLSGEYYGVGPSDIPSPFTPDRDRPLTASEIQTIVHCFVETIARIKEEGFDGVQLHAAHGGILSRFLSPYSNRRSDAYGGSTRNRARIISEIVSGARARVGDFPILIKLNCTDYVRGGLDIDNFPELATEVERAGFDAIEISGGMWDCLALPEEELGFRPVPAPESHTHIHHPEKQSYFLEYARRIALDIPVILVGGNKDVERLEEIVRQGHVQFIAMSRPFISEPDLPNRWLEGRGSSGVDCISCNSCIYYMIMHPGLPGPTVATCLFKKDRQQTKIAQKWLASWVEQNKLAPPQ